ncbi:HpcH/HpaI aldolase/citrate lyase family protein [Telmatospirillum sp. J64-1]|uniref:HpcH/HpaI aldolase family protein n=1 Tax=Telmatospirillum sp. J64-1 TaxID=2502183 RepID=UPI0021078C57|nr:aldolase/citrate lyase family protein [Telmatospirillum sp. J64-1]
MPMNLPRNAFKHAIARGERQIGLWSTLCSNIVAEIIGDSGFDWILLDMEHSPNEVPNILSQLQALTAATATPIVRPAWNDPVLIKRLLDIGAQTLLVPFVENAEEAARAVAAVRYPHAGLRGMSALQRANRYGRISDYHATAEREICLLVQIETSAALNNLEDIVTVEGIDGIFVGPSDLAANLGHIGNPGHPDVQDAIAQALAICQEAAIPAGILAPVESQARKWLDAGYTFVAVGSDVSLLARGADALALQYKKAFEVS